MKYAERYEWEIIHHPEDAEFVGRRFRSVDLQYGSWPEGAIFTNVVTGERLIWQDNKAVPLTEQGEPS